MGVSAFGSGRLYNGLLDAAHNFLQGFLKGQLPIGHAEIDDVSALA